MVCVQNDVERTFHEWLQSTEGQEQIQLHVTRLQELQQQTEQLQSGAGELFPQVAIDRNNEIARLVSCCIPCVFHDAAFSRHTLQQVFTFALWLLLNSEI